MPVSLTVRVLGLALAFQVSTRAASVREVTFGLEASESACALTRQVTSVESNTRQVFARVLLSGVRAGDSVTIDWVAPDGSVAGSAPYESLPAASSLCLLSQLPVAGFPAAQLPGEWRLRITSPERTLAEYPFTLTSSANPSGLSILAVERATLTDQQTQLTLTAVGFSSETSINLAQYTRSDGWKYLAHLLPESMEGNRIRVRVPHLTPAEYLVILRNPDGGLSEPARFVLETRTAYGLPYAANEHWRMTQGPYGAFSHFGRAQHAYDLAPGSSPFVRAMRAGTVRAYDLGLGQTPSKRIFGNYITIDHGDGEYSHYAHLKSGTFLVHTGEKVEAGQRLAVAGTSGYSFGVHLHVQVTRSAAISTPSIPFRFGEPAESKPTPVLSRWTGSLTLAAWWSQLMTVPAGASSLEVRLGHANPKHEFELHLVSPSGRDYNGEGESRHIDNPEPGWWRVSVQAVRGDDEALPFWVDHDVSTPPARKVTRAR